MLQPPPTATSVTASTPAVETAKAPFDNSAAMLWMACLGLPLAMSSSAHERLSTLHFISAIQVS